MTVLPLLAAHSISKRFGSTQALSNVSLSVERGQVLALLGENGAGKSTLVKILSGVIQPDEGELLIDGEQVVYGTRAAAHSGIHLVHQEVALLPERTVVENLFIGNEIRSRGGWLDWKKMRRLAAQAMQQLGVGEVSSTTPVRELSTGNQQMVEIARAIVTDARVVILDEPTAALSPHEAERLFEVIRDMTRRGVGVIYISHRLEEIVALADVATVLKDGTHVATRRVSDLTVTSMVTLMVGREIEDLFPHSDGPAIDRSVAALEVQDLCDPGAIESASFSVYPGEVVGVYGLEGHGQDEILACLAGDRTPATGRLIRNGIPHTWSDVSTMSREGFGYVPADRKLDGLILNLTGDQNITLPILRRAASQAGFVTTESERSLGRPAAADAGVRGDLTRPVSSLSGGNQQKVLLARLIASESTVLLLNQPTRGVDVGAKAEIYALIRRLCREKGIIALVVSREITEVLGLCDRVLVMSHGRLAGEHPRTASEEEVLATAVGSAV